MIIRFFLVSILSFSTLAQNIPKLENWANDFTNTLTKQELLRLNNKLKAYQDSTTNQIVVLIIQSLEGNLIEETANEIFRQNLIGTKKNDNGVLVLLSKDDREIRIEVGYGLESRLTDAVSSSIIRNEIIPSLKEGKYYGGINAGIDAIFRVIQGENVNEEFNKDEQFDVGTLITLIIFLIILSVVLKSNRTFRIGGYPRRYGGPWGGGFGGFGGGGFRGGGFSGGGGLSGGGGASGRW